MTHFSAGISANPLANGGTPGFDSVGLLHINVKGFLEDYNLDRIVDYAIRKHDLNARHREKALCEYRHFMMMAYKASRKRLWEHKQVVPTKNADKIWHAHILHTRLYMQFCEEVFGLPYIHHNPGLIEGTAAFEAAVNNTQRVDESMGAYAIDSDYFGGDQINPGEECSSCAT